MADVPADGAARAALEALHAVLDPDGLRELDPHDARDVIDEAWSALGAALGDEPGQASELVKALRTMHAADVQLRDHQLRVQQGTAKRLASVLTQLEQSALSVATVVEVAPRLICELGFDRAIVSQVREGVWVPEAVYVTGDPTWAAEIERAGREHLQPLVPGLFETEVVRRREAVAVYDVQANDRVHKAIADESRSRSYVVAPVLSRGKVMGFVHGDHYFKDREVDQHDRDLLVAFAEGLRLALNRAAIAERLQRTEEALKDLSATLAGAARGLGGDIRLQREPHEIETGPAALPWSGETPVGLSSDLTRREVEVLGLLAEGRTNAAIAKELVIAEATVKQHVKHVLRKVGAANRGEAIAVWFQSASHRP